MSPDEVLDELHMLLYEACKLKNWNFIQTAVLPAGTRTFIVWTADKRAKVVITGDKSTPFPGDVTLTSDTLKSSPASIAGAIAGAMR
jgi:hypothetical protein